MEQTTQTFWQKYKKYFIWGTVIIGLIILITYPVRVYNYCGPTEVDIIKYQTECKNNLSQAMTQVKGADQILTREENKLIETMQIAVSRYDKIEGAWAWIQEQNLQVSPAAYQQIRQTLEIYYAKFYATQSSLNDMTRAYERRFETFPFGFVAKLLGFPSQKYLDARPGQLVLEKGVNESYDSKEREMPDIPMSKGDTTKKK